MALPNIMAEMAKSQAGINKAKADAATEKAREAEAKRYFSDIAKAERMYSDEMKAISLRNKQAIAPYVGQIINNPNAFADAVTAIDPGKRKWMVDDPNGWTDGLTLREIGPDGKPTENVWSVTDPDTAVQNLWSLASGPQAVAATAAANRVADQKMAQAMAVQAMKNKGFADSTRIAQAGQNERQLLSLQNDLVKQYRQQGFDKSMAEFKAQQDIAKVLVTQQQQRQTDKAKAALPSDKTTGNFIEDTYKIFGVTKDKDTNKLMMDGVEFYKHPLAGDIVGAAINASNAYSANPEKYDGNRTAAVTEYANPVMDALRYHNLPKIKPNERNFLGRGIDATAEGVGKLANFFNVGVPTSVMDAPVATDVTSSGVPVALMPNANSPFMNFNRAGFPVFK